MEFKQLHNLVSASTGTLDRAAWLAAVPQLQALATTPQDPIYHAEGDVWTHTCMVVEALLGQAAYAGAGADDRFVLFMAALLHDISKPSCTVIDEETGRIGQPGHSRRGAIDARLLLWRAGVPFELRERICRLIRHHQLPFFALTGNRSGESPERLLHRLSWELPVWMLCAVAEADMEGRDYQSKADVLAEISLFRDLAGEEGCLYAPRAFADDHTRVSYFRGGRVAPDFPLFAEPGSEVIVMCGMPASGKNTYVAKHFPELPVVSFDDAREELGLRHGQNDGAAAHRATDKAKELLRQHKPFVWNATHLSAQMRTKTLDLLYAYKAKVRIIYLERPEAEIYRRNSKRDTSLKNGALGQMLFKWEVPLPVEAHSVEYLV